jgi:pimeloyl-ACP methyl ester carboxylesterase
MDNQGKQVLNLLGTSSPAEVSPAATPDRTWKLRGGSAWIYLANPKGPGITRPVILADGFHPGGTDLDAFWDGFERGPEFKFATELRRRGRDLVILGFDDCTASILDNAQTAIECIMRTIAERLGSDPLTVGGFSMGGLITRYALAKLETQRMDHQTAAYVCYDSPHHGAWMPIGLQALVHLLDRLAPQLGLGQQVNSPAAKQLLWQHLEGLEARPCTHPERASFLEALQRMGSWPQRPRLLGVANGMGKGTNGVLPDQRALEATFGMFEGIALYTQSTGDNRLVANLGPMTGYMEIRTTGMPEADGAHGGTLDSFKLVADALNAFIASQGGPPDSVKCKYDLTSFVPTSSAVAVETRIAPWMTLGDDVTTLSPDRTSLDDFCCASKNTRHTSITAELATWILERLP